MLYIVTLCAHAVHKTPLGNEALNASGIEWKAIGETQAAQLEKRAEVMFQASVCIWTKTTLNPEVRHAGQRRQNRQLGNTVVRKVLQTEPLKAAQRLQRREVETTLPVLAKPIGKLHACKIGGQHGGQAVVTDFQMHQMVQARKLGWLIGIVEKIKKSQVGERGQRAYVIETTAYKVPQPCEAGERNACRVCNVCGKHQTRELRPQNQRIWSWN